MTDALRCRQPGCTGTILDGYCDICGSPAGSAPMPVPSAGTSRDGDSPASGTLSSRSSGTSSNRIASTAIGSQRVAPGSRTVRRVGTSSTRLRRATLGAGLTLVPPAPVADPEHAIMVDPQVPEERRFCPSCNAPVGRSRGDLPGRTEGFCPKCRTPFSFAPKLTPGTLVNGQYEVAGCLAHGGLGWIYLARDKNVSDRWVVLKGLLNSGDADAYAAAVAERQFLAQVEHPLIVEIFNFVSHDGAGYTVMEYVGGTSLKAILKDRMAANRGRYDPLPIDQAIAYLVEILPAFGYLHDQGLLYCDFKPDNMIQAGDAVKLIDLGGVRRIGDLESAIYGTVGYQAPEVPEVGPSIASDIFTVGRTLAVLAMEFRGYQTRFVDSFPPVSDVPLFAEHDSLYRLLLKACAPDPADRFQSADELRVQLLGVLREIVAVDRPEEVSARHAAASVLFEAPTVASHELDWEHLPALRVDPADPMTAWLAALSVTDPVSRLVALDRAPEETVEVRLDRARTALAAARFDIVDTAIAQILADDPWEWRAVWLSGLAALAKNDNVAARSAFNAVYGQVPGELAPKLALGLACEHSGEHGLAETLYLTCARTDATYTAPAAFGLTRIRTDRRDLDGALAALDLVPATSRAYVEARRQRAGLLAGSQRGLPSLAEAMASIEAVTIDPVDRARLTANVLDSALRIVLDTGPQAALHVAGTPAAEPPLRDALERAYRDLAALSHDSEERTRLVDAANQVRRWTMR
jgi:serine/threonine-protein kinase PknG